MRVQGFQSAAGAGLVSVSTKGTPRVEAAVGEAVTFNRAECRWKRLRKNLGVAAKLHQISAQRHRALMVTLTYADANGWQPNHVKEYLRHVRQWFKRVTGDALRYVWVAEIQPERMKRTGQAVMHYHVVFWMPRHVTMPKADKRGWWPHGMTKTEVAQKAVGYVMKYASKFDTKQGIIHGARVYGVGGLAAADRGVRRWCNWPSFVQARAAVTDRFSPAPGGGWLDRSSGEWWPSEYRIVSTARSGLTVIERVRDHGRPIADVAGPYSWHCGSGSVRGPHSPWVAA